MSFSYNLKPSDLTLKNISFGLMRIYKDVYQRAGLGRHNGQKTLVFILGCQRSGTSMTYWIFERDLRVKIYREASELSSQDAVERIRLNPLPAVQETVAKDRVPIVVMKPLVESQRANDLLEYFPGSKIVWLYRHYQDVASSNLKAFGKDQGIEDLRPIVLQEPRNWRSERVSQETRETIRHYFSEHMKPYDAAALFWYARNQLFFDPGLDHSPRVMMCRYEELVRRPSDMMQRLYGFIGLPYPGDKIIKDVHPQSIGKGRQSRLSARVEALCETMLERLDAAHTKSRSASVYSNGVSPQAAGRMQEKSVNGNNH
jgi:hypothetical protein